MARETTVSDDTTPRSASKLRAEALRARLHAYCLADAAAAVRLQAYADELETSAALLEAKDRGG